MILHEKLFGSFLRIGFNCLKATKPLKGDILLFTTQSPGVPGTHLIHLGRMKGCGLPWNHPAILNLGLLDSFGNQHSNHYDNWEEVYMLNVNAQFL